MTPPHDQLQRGAWGEVPRSGCPLPEATCSLYTKAQDAGEDSAGLEGRVVFKGLPSPGMSYSLSESKETHVGTVPRVVVPASPCRV